MGHSPSDNRIGLCAARAAVVEVQGIGCTFSRSLTEEERAEVLGFLRRHVDAHKEYRRIGTLSLPLAEISAERIDEVRTLARGIELAGGYGGRWPNLESTVILYLAKAGRVEERSTERGNGWHRLLRR